MTDLFTIPLWGGWGDMLREVSLLPIAKLHWLGFKIRYENISPENFHSEANIPSEEEVKALFSRCPHLQGCKQGKSFPLEKIAIRSLRKLVEPWNTGLFDPQWAWKEEDQIPLESDQFHIAVQTHLAGLPSKKWPVEYWKTLLTELSLRFPHARIHVIDPKGEILADKGITIHHQLTFPQAVRLVESCHFLISVDSWSKYVAGWKNIPQIVIVPDQTSDYPHLTAEAVWRHSFRGLRHTSKNKTNPPCQIVGLAWNPTKRKIDYTFGAMAHLRISDVTAAIDTFHFSKDT